MDMHLFLPARAALLLSAMLGASAQAQVLECTDSQGRKEFTTVCPPGTVSQKELRSKGVNQPETDDALQSSWQEQDRAFQQRRLERESAEAEQAQKQKQQQIAERKCAQARRKMEQLTSGRRLRWVDKTTGERPVMTDEEHAAEMKSVAEELRLCRS